MKTPFGLGSAYIQWLVRVGQLTIHIGLVAFPIDGTDYTFYRVANLGLLNVQDSSHMSHVGPLIFLSPFLSEWCCLTLTS